MKSLKWMLVGALALGVWTSGLQAQLSDTTLKAQNKLLAIRAARADAMRKLGERINGLFITSETHVKDFVTQNDTIKTAMTAWLSGMKETDKPKINEDGTAEVTLEITLEEIMINLEQISERYQKGGKFVAKDFEQMTVTNKEKAIRETGMGAPRPLESAGETVAVTAGTSFESLTYMSASAKKWWLENVDAQQRLMATRAARVDGMRRLGERLNGVFISSKTKVKDFIAESDDIHVNMATFLVGAKEAGVRYHDDEPIVEVDMEVTLTSILASLKTWGEAHYKGDKVNLKSMEELTVTTKDTVYRETGMGVAKTKAGVVVASSVTVAAAAPGWISETLSVTGNAAIDTNKPAAQAKLMAFRGAELDARRKLSEQISGLMITSSTSVKDFVTQSDVINTHMMDFQVGAGVKEGSQKVMEDGTAEVTVEIEMRPLWNMFMYYAKKESLTIK
jgi:hypothetical protein